MSVTWLGAGGGGGWRIRRDPPGLPDLQVGQDLQAGPPLTRPSVHCIHSQDELQVKKYLKKERALDIFLCIRLPADRVADPDQTS